MKKSFLNLLRCPKTRETLKLTIHQQEKDDIIEGFLSSSNFKYKITNGIPRFINNDGYSKNFGWQWKKWSRTQFENKNTGLPMEKYTINMFKKITEFNAEKISGKLVLDIGCGSGRFTDVANSLGAKMVAIDYSSAIDVCKKNLNNGNILFVQGDALNLPFNDDIFDYSFSIGVLHHTPDPYIGVKEAFRVLKKKNAEYALSVYKKKSYYDFITVRLWKKLFNFFRPFTGHLFPFLYSQFFGRLNFYLNYISKYLSLFVRLFFPSIVLKDLEWSILDTFDSLTPSYQSTHTLYEVFTWFKKAEFKEIRIAEWENIIGKTNN